MTWCCGTKGVRERDTAVPALQRELGVYHTMLVAFFVFEGLKEDVAAPVVPVTAYATCVRRRVTDITGKLVRTGGRFRFDIAAYSLGPPHRKCPS